MIKFPFILFISGVSGVGKTTITKKMEYLLAKENAQCFYFDSIGVPSVQHMIADYGEPSEWQRAMTHKWVERLLIEFKKKKIVVFEGQINLQFIVEACAKYHFTNYQILLIHCDNQVRHERLRMQRNQPELINKQMDDWASFLKHQAKQMDVQILDSGKISVDEIVDSILKIIKDRFDD